MKDLGLKFYPFYITFYIRRLYFNFSHKNKLKTIFFINYLKMNADCEIFNIYAVEYVSSKCSYWDRKLSSIILMNLGY